MISIRRIQAIFIKDYKDLMKNSYMLFTMALPLFFAFWIGRDEVADPVIYLLPITLALVVGGAFIQAGMIAEEKEKNTLRGLLLTPLSIIEIFIGKSLLSAVSTLIVVCGTIWISRFVLPESLLVFIFAVLLCLIIYIAIGTILGLLSRTVMETTIVGMPVLILFGMGSMFTDMIEAEWVVNILSYLPNEQFNLLVIDLYQGSGIEGITDHLILLMIWALVTLIGAIIIYGKKRFD